MNIYHESLSFRGSHRWTGIMRAGDSSHPKFRTWGVTLPCQTSPDVISIVEIGPRNYTCRYVLDCAGQRRRECSLSSCDIFSLSDEQCWAPEESHSSTVGVYRSKYLLFTLLDYSMMELLT
jgi:hypothetical protein